MVAPKLTRRTAFLVGSATLSSAALSAAGTSQLLTEPIHPRLRLQQIPPYGFAPVEFAAPVSSASRNADSLPRENHLASSAISRTCIRELSLHVWPIYDQTQLKWVGKAGRDAAQLCCDDIALMAKTQPMLETTVTSLSIEPAKQIRLFRDEDNLAGEDQCGISYGAFSSGRTLFEYTASTQPRVTELIAHLISEGSHRQMINIILFDLKNRFQRPRPNQMAYLLGHESLTFRRAKTAFTASLPSGHSFEALVAGAVAYVQFRTEIDSQLRSALSQYVVDIGDRRVYGGVHYPSDNIASWYCSLAVCEYFFPLKMVSLAREFIWSAVRERSTVYRLLLDFTSHSSPIHARMGWLHERVREYGLPVH